MSLLVALSLLTSSPAWSAAVLTFRSDAPIHLYVDGQKAASTTLGRAAELQLEPGAHTLRLESITGRVLHSGRVDIEDYTALETRWYRRKFEVMGAVELPGYRPEDPSDPVPEGDAVEAGDDGAVIIGGEASLSEGDGAVIIGAAPSGGGDTGSPDGAGLAEADSARAEGDGADDAPGDDRAGDERAGDERAAPPPLAISAGAAAGTARSAALPVPVGSTAIPPVPVGGAVREGAGGVALGVGAARTADAAGAVGSPARTDGSPSELASPGAEEMTLGAAAPLAVPAPADGLASAGTAPDPQPLSQSAVALSDDVLYLTFHRGDVQAPLMGIAVSAERVVVTDGSGAARFAMDLDEAAAQAAADPDAPGSVLFFTRDGRWANIYIDGEVAAYIANEAQATLELEPGTYEVEIRDARGKEVWHRGELTVEGGESLEIGFARGLEPQVQGAAGAWVPSGEESARR